MKFNKFIWNIFKESNNGREMIEFFSQFQQVIDCNPIVYRKILNGLHYEKREMSDWGVGLHYQNIMDVTRELYKRLQDSDIESEITTFDKFEKIFDFLTNLPDLENDYSKLVFRVDDISFLSECLYHLYPEYCFPYYFDRLYHVVVAIFNEFWIFLPAMPKKNDMCGRMFHYVELCRSIYDFRMKHEMDEYELSAFLYGFATEIVKKYEITDVLPEPRKAYFIGGGKKDKTVDASGDFDYLDKVDNTTITPWNGNPETQPGDIIVMYCLSPRSYIHSVWRAVTPGSYDPFFYFYKTVYIGQPVFVNPISIEEMKNDEILSEMSLVKANMQGINGRIIEKKYYDRILELLKQKGGDTEHLPQLSNEFFQEVKLSNEKDVEKYLLEPLLQKLGYNETDWKRQLKLRMGRGDRVYPDYVIFPKEERNNESGYWIWEAKLTISSKRQLKEDFGQAKSYALRLNCKGLGLISKDGVWLSESNFYFEKIRFWSWKQINESGYFNEIFDVAGNKKRN